MKLIGDNAGRRPIAFQSPSQGVNAEQNVNTQTPIVLDNQGGVVLAGSTSFNDGNGIFLGWCNGIPVFSLGSDSGGMSWDGSTLNVAGAISALSGFISGDLNIGTGGDIRSGMTAYMTGTGFWIDYNGGSPRFCIGNPAGDYLAFNGTALNGVVTTGILQALTSNLIDDIGLGNTADITQTANLPPSVAQAIAIGLMLDAQASLGISAGVRNALFSSGGVPFWADLFGGTCDGQVMGGTNWLAADTTVTGSMVTYGNLFDIPNVFPGSVTVLAFAQCNFFTSGGTGGGANAGSVQLQISLDGGSTWTTSSQVGSTRIPDISHTYPAGVCLHSVNGTPTGDIQIRLQAQQGAGTDTLKLQAASSAIGYVILNSSNGNIIGTGPLAVSIPATQAMSCTSTSPVTSCTAVKNTTGTITGGVGPWTKAWTKVAGTGTLSGTTGITCTTTDTENTTTGGATHTTTINLKVTDSQTYSTTAGTRAAGNATLTIGPHQIPIGATVTVSGCTPTAYNGTFVITGVSATTITYVLAGSGNITVNGTVNGVNVTSSNDVITGTFTLQYAAVTNNLTGTGKPQCLGSPGSSCNASTTLTNNPAGGDGSYTYANTRTVGSFTLSGSTSKSFTCSESGVIPGSDTGTAKGTITDGHSNTGNASKSLTFTWNSNA